jgi:DNA replication protein DnaC
MEPERILASRAKERVPKRYLDARLNDATKSCKQVKAFLESDDIFLLLTGRVGIGKTYACYAGIIERNGGGVYHKAVRLGQLLFSDKVKTIADMEDTGLLILDDIGTEIITDKQWFNSILDSIIDYRYEWMHQTILTTNLTMGEFKSRYGERIMSRLTETGKAWELGGKDLRKSDVKPEPKKTEPLKQEPNGEEEPLPELTDTDREYNRQQAQKVIQDLAESKGPEGR